MSPRVIVVITIVQVIAVPVLAFLLRMAFGDTKSQEEKLISDALRAFLSRIGIPMENYGTD